MPAAARDETSAVPPNMPAEPPSRAASPSRRAARRRRRSPRSRRRRSRRSGRRPHVCGEDGDVAAIEALIARAGNLTATRDDGGWSALTWAASEARADAVAALLKHGAAEHEIEPVLPGEKERAEHATALGGVQGAHVDRVEPADARALAVGPRLGGEHGAPPRRRRRPPDSREDDAVGGDRRRREERLRQHAAQAGDGRPVPPRAEGRDRGGEGGAALPVRVHRALRRRGRLGRRVGGRPRLSAVGAAGALLEAAAKIGGCEEELQAAIHSADTASLEAAISAGEDVGASAPSWTRRPTPPASAGADRTAGGGG